MAAFNGDITGGALLSESPTNPDLGGKDTIGDVQAWLGADPYMDGPQTSTQPTDMPANAQPALNRLADAFGFLDWFNKIHLEYAVFNLGALVSTQVEQFYVFSSFFVPRTLNSIGAVGDAGLTLTPPLGETYPQTYQPWEERIYTLTVDTDGPPSVEATYTFNFDNRSYTLEVTGQRVVPWFVPPNWQYAITERLEFRTDVMRHFDGSEQRAAIRGDSAHWIWGFRWNADGDTMRILENVLYQWSSRVWALPIFPQGAALDADLPQGATVINVDTSNLDYHADGLAIMHNLGSPEIVESVEIESVSPTSITAKRGTTRAWPGGTTYIYPARTARMTRTAKAQRFTHGHLYGQTEFRCTEPFTRTPISATTYRGYPVLESAPDWAQDPAIEYARKMVAIELGMAPGILDDQSGLAEPIIARRWTFATRQDIEDFRRWLFARLGRCRAVWVPTFNDDLIVNATIAAAGLNLDVKRAGITTYVAGDVHRRDIRIRTRDGQVYYRRASAYVEVDEATERLSIDTALGQVYDPIDFLQVSWMSLFRLDQDGIEIAHWTGDVATSVTVMKAPRNNA